MIFFNLPFQIIIVFILLEISLVYCQTILKDVTNLPTNRLRIVPETIRFRLASEMIVECPLILSQTSPYVLLRSNAGEQIFLSENQQNELNQQLQSVYASKHFVKRFPLANKPQKIRFNQNSENALVCKVLDKNRFDYGNITLRLVSDTDSDHRNRMQPPSLSLSDSDFHESHSDSLQLKFSRIPPTSIRKRVGESTKFSCSVTSSSYIDEQVNMAWFKNYRLIASSESIDTEAIPSYPDHHRYSMRNGKLTIRSLRRQDAGNYTCLAYNQFGRVNATTSLEVIDKDDLKPKFHNCSRHLMYESRSVVFSCFVSSAEPILAMWLRRVDCDQEDCKFTAGRTKLYKLDRHFYRRVSSLTMTNRSPVTTNKHSPSAKYPVELTVRQVQMSNAGTYACLVTNSHGFTFRFIDFPLTSASLVSSFDDTQRWNRFVSLLSGSICIVLAIVTLTLRCFLSIKQQKTKKSINQTDVNKSANVLLNNVSHHLQNPYQLNHLRNPLLVSTNNPIDASSVNCVLPNQSQSKCNFGNYFGTIPNQLPLISPTVN